MELFGISPLVTEHSPFILVMHEKVPVKPPLHAPSTIAFSIGLWFSSCTTNKTVAVQVLAELIEILSKSPIWIVSAGIWVGVTVGPGVGVIVGVDVGP